ncbi:MAG: PTS sugar transporter subunit IIB [Candidatus Eisenbacteria bacterium]|nr:PTS sugar transporter subunit IIB [Candidatus Eisenbacteria bacterium]
MSWVLHRLDDRLIHGQVLVAWGQRLSPQRIVIVDDAVAASEWERQLWWTPRPASTCACFPWRRPSARTPPRPPRRAPPSLLLRDLPTALRLVEAGAEIAAFNVGGLHHAPGKDKVAEYVYLDDADRAAARALHARHIGLDVQDVPASRAVPLASIEPLA